MLYVILYLLFVLPFKGRDRLETAEAINTIAKERNMNNEALKAWVFLLAQESAFDTDAINKNSGALGIGQVMPQYVKYFQSKIKDTSADPMSLYGGLRMSAWVFKDCYNRFPSVQGAWACYYSGANHACTKAVHNNDFTKQCPNTYKHVRRIFKNYNRWLSN